MGKEEDEDDALALQTVHLLGTNMIWVAGPCHVDHVDLHATLHDHGHDRTAVVHVEAQAGKQASP